MSALPPIADIKGRVQHVRFGPEADIEARQFRILFRSCGLLDPRVDLATKHHKIDRLGKKRLGAALQRLALGLGVAIGRSFARGATRR